jgi:hypothetical protein
MGEPLRKLEINGGDFAGTTRIPSTSTICFTPHRPFRTPRMSLTIPT